MTIQVVGAVLVISASVGLAYQGHLFVALALAAGYAAGFVVGTASTLDMLKLL